MVRLLLLRYDGTDLSGCPEVAGRRTVCGLLRTALEGLGGRGLALETLSRTDAGVHARHQVAVVGGAIEAPTARWGRSLARHLPDDLRAVAVAEVGTTPSVRGKRYRYELDLDPVGDPWRARTSWRPAQRLDPDRLAPLAADVVGTRSWQGFARRGETRDDLTRALTAARWVAQGSRWTFEVEGEGFTYRLVRSLVGAMVAVASGTCSEAQWRDALDGRPSPAGRQQAPARGLTLEHLALDPEPAWIWWGRP